MHKISPNLSSYQVAKKIYKPLSLKNIVKRLAFLLTIQQYTSIINTFSSRLNKIDVPVTAEMVGTVIWPYIHNEWDVKTRLDTIATHYEILSTCHPKLSHIKPRERLRICNFSHVSESVTVEIDRAKWFTREGELTINIFRENLRIASMAFSLSKSGKEIVAYIGAVQGIHGGIPSKESLDIYKALTKDFSGLRPRSMLLEVLKVVVHKLGARKIFGISEQNRHYRHKYFGNDQNTIFKTDYNTFWEEHSGMLNLGVGFFEIPMQPAIRDVSEIASKKRGQYRRRNAFINTISNAVNLEGELVQYTRI